jgi:hypothetical protein
MGILISCYADHSSWSDSTTMPCPIIHALYFQSASHTQSSASPPIVIFHMLKSRSKGQNSRNEFRRGIPRGALSGSLPLAIPRLYRCRCSKSSHSTMSDTFNWMLSLSHMKCYHHYQRTQFPVLEECTRW